METVGGVKAHGIHMYVCTKRGEFSKNESKSIAILGLTPRAERAAN